MKTRNILNLIAKHLVTPMVVTSLFSCQFIESRDVQTRNAPPKPTSFDQLRGSDISTQTFAPINANSRDSEAMIALAEARLYQRYASKLSAEWSTNRGVLNEILTPSIRKEVASSGMIGILSQIPGISAIVGSFTSDQKLHEKVITGLVTKINGGLKRYGGTRIDSRLAINFDHFVLSQNGVPSFVVMDQAARWNLLWTIDGVWNNEKPMDNIDHGLQVLGILRSLSEWAYIFDMDGNGQLARAGGLVKQIHGGTPQRARAVASEDPQFESQILSGVYQFTAPPNTPLFQLATKGGESWNTVPAPINLHEQASLWLGAAKAFKRLRADQRQFTSEFFQGSDPMLSAKTTLLPLAFLNNMGYMLSKHFINEQKQEIYQEACDGNQCVLASPQSIARLALAVSLWLEATQNIQTAGIDPSTANKITASLGKLKTALQLIVRTLSSDLTASKTINGKTFLVVADRGGASVNAVSSAEVIGTLAKIERSQLRSQLLSDRVLSMAHGHAATFLVSTNTESSTAATAWTARMVAELSLSYPHRIDWIPKIKGDLKSTLGEDWKE